MDLTFRDSVPGDLTMAADACYGMWFRKDYGEHLGRLISDAYAAMHYRNADLRVTAVLDGEPEGVCFVRTVPGETDSSDFDSFSEEEGFEVAMGDMRILQRADEGLKREFRIEADAEVLLLMVGSRSRGRGIGRRLLDEAASRLSYMGCRSFMLFTDDDCDYGFYDKIGMKKRGMVIVDFHGYPLKRIAYAQEIPKKN
jgi:GNAT superfamily N-acetyltransferase